jgi:hypothetical protein
LKKFLCPYKIWFEPTFLTGSLAVWNALGLAFYFAHPSIPSRAKRGEDRIPFELFQEYTASWKNASFWKIPRGGKAAARLGFERAFLAKRKRIYQ